MTWLVVLATIVILIGFNALYVAAEFATISARRSRIAQMAEEEENRAAQLLLPLMEDVHRLDTYVAACQIGITISSLVLGFYGQATLSVYLTPYLVQLGGLAEVTAQSISATVVLLLLTVFQVVLGELVPKNIGVQYPERLALLTVYPMRWSLAILRPLIWFFNGSGRLILRLIGVKDASEHAHIHAPEEILMLVEESGAGGLLEKEERRLLENTLRLRELTTRQVMIPRTRMFAASVDLPVGELLELLAESPYSRLPLYEESVDNIVGLVHLKDLLCLHQFEDDTSVRAVMREMRFVFESTPADEVFVTLQKQQYNMAIVLDEYGGTAGMVTLEDLVEEIFGELQDEFDIELPVLQIQSDNRIVLRGDALIADLNDWLDLYLDSDEVDTLAGLLLSEAGDVPDEKDEFEIAALRWRIEKMDGKAIQSVSVVVSPEKARQLREERL
ncbi:DUF21 domain-containing protein [bacterium]|nr:DUF21 domain-containing protein [bacterium]